MEVKICEDRLFASCRDKLCSLFVCSFSLYMLNSSLLTVVPESQEVIKIFLNWRATRQKTLSILPRMSKVIGVDNICLKEVLLLSIH